MHRVLVDEDLPRSLAGFLGAQGVDATDVRDIGLRSAPEVSSRVVNEAVAKALRDVPEAEIVGAVVIVSPGGVRIHRRRR